MTRWRAPAACFGSLERSGVASTWNLGDVESSAVRRRQPGERPELHAPNLVAAALQLREASRRSIARYSDDS